MKSLACGMLAISLTVTGCYSARGPTYSPLAVDSQSAAVYVYRSSTFVGSADWDVPTLYLDGKPMGSIRIDGYIPMSVPAGSHVLRVMKSKTGMGKQTEEVSRLDISVKPGDVVYVKYFVSMSDFALFYPNVAVSRWTYRLAAVPESVGATEIQDTQAAVK